MTHPLTLPSPAKLNLFLHITGRRSDGYHELQTLFQLIDYGDTLTFQRREDDKLYLSPSMTDIPHDDNLIIKAARLLQKNSGSHWGADIHIDKRLPMGGGIGGGSSNAATTLVALNHLWDTNINTDDLAQLGLDLGADVPVFIRGHSAWAEGIGEILQAIELPERWYLIIKPNCHISTAEIFSHEELTRDTAAITVATFFERGGKNDSESVVCQIYPEVKRAMQWLQQHGKAQITGTGACVFSSFASKEQAETVLKQAPTEWKCFVAKGINRSPLQHLLRD